MRQARRGKVGTAHQGGLQESDGRGGARFEELWPLQRVRCGLFVAGVAGWLWERDAGAGLIGTSVAGVGSRGKLLSGDGLLETALLLSLALLTELPMYGRARPRAALGWCALQAACAFGAFILAPGLPTALVACAVLAGAGSALPAGAAWALWGVATGAAVAAIGFIPAELAKVEEEVAWVGGWALSTWLGRLFASRLTQDEVHRRTVAELEAAQERLSRTAETARELAAAQARERLSSAVHDGIGHALVGTLLQVQVAGELIERDPEAARERLRAVERSLRETLGNVRKLLAHGGSDRAGLPLHLALQALAAEMEAAGGPRVELHFKPDAGTVSEVNTDAAAAIYRCVQEALTNAVRHGKASRVEVEVEAASERLYVRVTDDGEGAGTYTPGMGLSGMVSRIQALGGTICFRTSPGEGFQVEIGVRRR